MAKLKTSAAQRKASQRWAEKNRARKNYNNRKSDARAFIAMATDEDLIDIAARIQMRLRNISEVEMKTLAAENEIRQEEIEIRLVLDMAADFEAELEQIKDEEARAEMLTRWEEKVNSRIEVVQIDDMGNEYHCYQGPYRNSAIAVAETEILRQKQLRPAQRYQIEVRAFEGPDSYDTDLIDAARQEIDKLK